jgi:hypothetical protein
MNIRGAAKIFWKFWSLEYEISLSLSLSLSLSNIYSVCVCVEYNEDLSWIVFTLYIDGYMEAELELKIESNQQ